VTKQKSVIDINRNELKYNVNGNSLTSVLPVTRTVQRHSSKAAVTFSKTVQKKKIIFNMHYNDSSQFK